MFCIAAYKMNPLKVKAYSRAEASLLRSSGLSVQQIAKLLLEQSEQWLKLHRQTSRFLTTRIITLHAGAAPKCDKK